MLALATVTGLGTSVCLCVSAYFLMISSLIAFCLSAADNWFAKSVALVLKLDYNTRSSISASNKCILASFYTHRTIHLYTFYYDNNLID